MSPAMMLSVAAQAFFVVAATLIGMLADPAVGVPAAAAVGTFACVFIVYWTADRVTFHRTGDDNHVALCVDHHHLRPAAAAFAFFVPRSVSCSVATAAVVWSEPSTMASALCVALVVEIGMFAVTSLLSAQLGQWAWPEDMRAIGRMRDGEPPVGRPAPRPLRDSLVDFDNTLARVLSSDNPPHIESMTTVGALEDWLVSTLYFRGKVASTDERLVNAAVREMAYEDPDRRNAWRGMALNRATWINVRRAYQSLMVEVLRRQNDSTHSAERPPEVELGDCTK